MMTESEHSPSNSLKVNTSPDEKREKEQRQSLHGHASPEIHSRAKTLRRQMTPAEKTLWAHLRRLNASGFKFRRQHPFRTFILDFYCHEVGLVIELDGEVHEERLQCKRDQARTEDLNFAGLQVLRFQNREVFQEIDRVLAVIRAAIEARKRG